MRVVPLQLLAVPFAVLSLLLISGCGGSASMQSNTTSTASVIPSTANAAPPSTSASAPTGTSAPGSAPPSSNPPSSSPTPSAPPPPNPATPTNSTGTTVSNIEQMPGWDSCDTCSGGGTIAYSMTSSLNYPQPGTTQFSLGQGSSWAHALWWKRLGNDVNASHFVLTLDEYMENPGASFGVEYEANQIVDGGWYDFAIQCSFGYGIWQLWDPANQRWVPTSVPCARPAPSSHSQLRLEFARSNGQVLFVSIGTNGNIVPVNTAFNPQPISGANGDFGVHIQLNANANPDPYSLWVHDFALTYW